MVATLQSAAIRTRDALIAAHPRGVNAWASVLVKFDAEISEHIRTPTGAHVYLFHDSSYLLILSAEAVGDMVQFVTGIYRPRH